MAIPRIPRRWRLRTLMIVVALCAVGLVTYRVRVERAPVYQMIGQLRTSSALARSEAAIRIGLMGPRAAVAAGVLEQRPGRSRSGRAGRGHVCLDPGRLEIGPRAPCPGRGDRHAAAPVAGRLPSVPHLPATGPGSAGGWAPSDGGFSDDDPVGALTVFRPPAAVVVPMLERR